MRLFLWLHMCPDMHQQHIQRHESWLLGVHVCVCGCSVCSAVQLSLCASQHLGSFHDAYHLQVLQVTTHCSMYQTIHMQSVCVQTQFMNPPSFESCLICLWLVKSGKGHKPSSCALMQRVA